MNKPRFWQSDDLAPMHEALDQARRAGMKGEVPVGAVIIDPSGATIARAHNLVEELNDPTAHAEILAIRAATASLRSKSLHDCALYVTLEPCNMCAQAIAFARITRLYFGASDPKGGGIEHGGRIFDQPTCHHRPSIIGGVAAASSAQLLQDFFRSRR